MGKILTIASQKGGVGKTTTTLNLAYSMSRLGGRVLVVDGDPQGGIAVASNLKKKTSLGIVQALRNECDPSEILAYSKDNSLAFVGAGIVEQEDVLFFEDQLNQGNVGNLITGFAEAFDYTFIDIPAGVGALVVSMLKISDRVIMILQPKTISLRTLPSFLKMIHWVIDRFNSSLQLEGVLFTMVNERSSLELNLLGDARKSLPEEIFLKTSIPLDENFEKASMKAMPVAMLGDGQEAARSYMHLAMELKERDLLTAGRRKEEKEHVEGLF
jgi:chromosome partitioning protein